MAMGTRPGSEPSARRPESHGTVDPLFEYTLVDGDSGSVVVVDGDSGSVAMAAAACGCV